MHDLNTVLVNAPMPITTEVSPQTKERNHLSLTILVPLKDRTNREIIRVKVLRHGSLTREKDMLIKLMQLLMLLRLSFSLFLHLACLLTHLILLSSFAPSLRDAFSLNIASSLHAMHGSIILFPYTIYGRPFLFMHNLLRSVLSSIAQPRSLYIHLSSSAKDTAWSVHCISTYLSRQYIMYFPLTLIYLIIPCNLDLSESLL